MGWNWSQHLDSNSIIKPSYDPLNAGMSSCILIPASTRTLGKSKPRKIVHARVYIPGWSDASELTMMCESSKDNCSVTVKIVFGSVIVEILFGAEDNVGVS